MLKAPLVSFKFHFNYFLFWIFIFLSSRTAFLLIHIQDTWEAGLINALYTFRYGLKLDLSTIAYICVLPFFLQLFSFANLKISKLISKITFIITFLFITLTFLITVADYTLYKFWKHKIDASILPYLQFPRQAVASIPTLTLLSGIFVVMSISCILIYIYFNHVHTTQIRTNKKNKLTFFLTSLFLWILLLVPIRGGFQLAPINQSSAYFSTIPFLNHAAINTNWNFFQSLSENIIGKQNLYYFFETEAAKKILRSSVDSSSADLVQISSVKKPNIILIILESWTAGFIQELGGTSDATPQFSQLTKESVLFTKFYANGDRTDKGVVAVLSGYPAQPTNTIMNQPEKAAKLPMFARELNNLGYTSAFYYGGEIDFVNMKSYLMSGGFNKIVSKKDFNPADCNSKWGAYDHALFKKISSDISKLRQPFFMTALTLSSHEPFEVPDHSETKFNSESERFKNAIQYSDSALGAFIYTLKQSDVWQNSLIVLVADHGHTLPLNSGHEMPEKYHIPLMISGGALPETFRGKKIETIGSQIDIPTTLLRNLDLPSTPFVWSNDILRAINNPTHINAGQALYVFGNGFGFIHQQGVFIYDQTTQKTVRHDIGLSKKMINFAKASMQIRFQDYLDK